MALQLTVGNVLLWAALAVYLVVQGVFLLGLVRRRALPARIIDVAHSAAAIVAVIGWRFGAQPEWLGPATALVALGTVLVTHRELGLPRGSTRIREGQRLPSVKVKRTDGAEVDASTLAGPALLTMYRGWWCPYCVTQLGEIDRDHAALADAGLQLYAVSVDRPDEQKPLEDRMQQRVTFLSDERGTLVDALALRHMDGVPWYDRVLFGARRQDISLPVSVLIGADGVIRKVWRAPRIDIRPSTAEIIAAHKS